MVIVIPKHCSREVACSSLRWVFCPLNHNKPRTSLDKIWKKWNEMTRNEKRDNMYMWLAVGLLGKAPKPSTPGKILRKYAREPSSQKSRAVRAVKKGGCGMMKGNKLAVCGWGGSNLPKEKSRIADWPPTPLTKKKKERFRTIPLETRWTKGNKIIRVIKWQSQLGETFFGWGAPSWVSKWSKARKVCWAETQQC